MDVRRKPVKVRPFQKKADSALKRRNLAEKTKFNGIAEVFLDPNKGVNP